MKASIQKISPDQAKEMLNQNCVNRKLSKLIVKNYSRTMSSGLWKPCGSMIQISTSGQLLDGQHRLNAIIDSDSYQDFVVLEDVPSDHFKCLDLGRPRTAKDALMVLGYRRPGTLASSIRFLNEWKRGDVRSSVVKYATKGSEYSRGWKMPIAKQITKSEIIDQAIKYCTDYPIVVDLADIASASRVRFHLVPEIVYATFLMMANEICNRTLEQSKIFLEELVSCTGGKGPLHIPYF